MALAPSYWTKRRKLQASVQRHLDSINIETDPSDVQSNQSHSEFEDSHEFQTTEEIDLFDVELFENISNEDNLSPIDVTPTLESSSEIDVNNIPVFDMFSDEYDYHSYIPHESSDDSDNDDPQDDFDLRSSLKEWAVQFNISHNALSQLLMLLQTVHPDLPKDPRTLLRTKTTYEIKSITGGGSYYHFGIRRTLEKLLKECSNVPVSSEMSVSLMINIDGLPLFRSASTQFWPILAKIEEPELTSEPVIVGLFCGEEKPKDVHQYLQEFIDEMLELQNNGFTLSSTHVKVQIHGVICDTPARAFVKQTKGHSGYSGCDKCTEAGQWQKKMTFPGLSAPLRTDTAFDEMADENHHNAESPFTRLSLGMVSQFPLDYMHLVCLGVVKRLLLAWIRGPLHYRIGGQAVSLISERLLSYTSFIPREFNRKCRSLADVDRWKATEFRFFLLYGGIVALKNNLRDEFYRHFLLFSVSIYCLASPFLCLSHVDYSEELLQVFVQQFGLLYGANNLVYNVHCLIHLANDVRKYGPVDKFSAFPFENFLAKMKKMVRSPTLPLQQVIRRISEQSLFAFSCNSSFCGIPVREHFNGPLPNSVDVYRQYKEVKFKSFVLTLNASDNCVKIGSKFGLIRNILTHDDNSNSVLLVFEEFCRMSDFFTYPLHSSELDIVKVSHLSGTYTTSNLSDVIVKCLRLPYKDAFIVIPLLHQ